MEKRRSRSFSPSQIGQIRNIVHEQDTNSLRALYITLIALGLAISIFAFNILYIITAEYLDIKVPLIAMVVIFLAYFIVGVWIFYIAYVKVGKRLS
jgi:hypothetical protein